jgi:hypothetical protein
MGTFVGMYVEGDAKVDCSSGAYPRPPACELDALQLKLGTSGYGWLPAHCSAAVMAWLRGADTGATHRR